MHTPVRVLILLAVVTGLLLQPGQPGLAQGPKSPGSGPAGLLHGLWTPEELAGSPADRVNSPVGEPDHSLPKAEGLALPAFTPVPPELRGVIRRVRVPRTPAGGGRKVVAITFDLCERANNTAGYDDRIVNLLRARGLKATFFAGGKWMRSHPEKAMQLMADPLFELGGHTWTHGNLALMDAGQIRTQMEPTQVQYMLLRRELARRAEARGLGAHMAGVPEVLPFMRLPYGRSSQPALEELAAQGYPAIQWDVEGERDEEVHSPAEIARTDLRLIRPGSIVLMHANAVPQKTFAVLPRVLDGLRRRGYRLVTVGELLRMGPVEAVADGFFSEPGDNRQYDGIFPGKGTLRPDPSRPYTTVPVP